MLERVLRFSIEQRWLVLLLTLFVATVGAAAFLRLPIDAVPDITNNQVQINTVFPSLTPFEIEKQVTFPIETALAGIPGLEYTRSLSRNGFSQVTAVFKDGLDVYFARQQVAERLHAAREQLLPGAEPTMGPVSTGLGEVYMYTVGYEHAGGKGATYREGEAGWQREGAFLTPEERLLTSDLELSAYLREVQDWIIRPQLRNLKDIAGVDSIGGYEKQYHVQPDPMLLVSYGLSFNDLIEALEKNNVSTGAGYVEHKGEAYTVLAAGRIQNEEQIAGIVIGSHGGAPVYVRNVASVGIGRELRSGSASKDGADVVVGTALMLIGANSRTVAHAVDEKIAEIRRLLPAGIEVRTVLDRTVLVNATIETVAKNLLEGAVLVIVVLFLLLGNFRAAVVTALAIPLSMLFTATCMVQSGISGNLMSLGAIDFGIIVDGSVIIVENCLRMLAERQHQLGRTLSLRERLDTVFAASRQVRSATAFGEAIIITVYIPILTLIGIEGKMFRPMAATVIFALAGAFVLSLTFVPAMVAVAIRGRVREKENVLVRWSKRGYEPMVRWAIKWRWILVSASVVIFAGSLVLFLRLGQEFVPTLDEKNIAMHAMRIPSTSLTQSSEMQKEVEVTVSRFPEVALVFSKTGTAEIASDPMPPNVSDTFIMLKPEAEWPNPSLRKIDLIARIEKAVDELPGNRYEFTQPIQMRFNELIAGVRGDIVIKVYGDDFDGLTMAAEQIAAILAEVPGAEDVKVEQTTGLPIMGIEVDRHVIGRYGLSAADVQDVIQVAVGGRKAGQVFEGDRRFDLVVRLPEAARRDLKSLDSLPIPLPRHEIRHDEARLAIIEDDAFETERPGFIPLDSVARIEVAEGPNQISRENGKRRVFVQANVRSRDIGSFVNDAKSRIEGNVRLPPGSWLDWGGQFENLEHARERLAVVVPICFFLIFLLLFSTFNSVKYALLVFTGVPLALTGGIVALWLRSMPFSISAGVGFIALSGVAVLNGLVMVTFINDLMKEGRTLEYAILHGSLTRLRPVLMTALVASLGFAPMAIATGTGAEVQKPLATVVIGGIVSSTLLTLIVLPALYRLWHRERREDHSQERSASCAEA